jgi:hypothetical protein
MLLCKEDKREMNAHDIQQSDKRAIEGLQSEGPDPQLEEKLMLFGQFVGDWDILEDRFYLPDGTRSSEPNLTRGELHWGWILDGRAVQDVWMSIDEKTRKAIPEGTTIRFYDQKIDAWHSVWISPNQGVVRTFVARQVGDEIVLEGRTAEGYPSKWIFSEITPDSFRWRSEETRDDGKTWTLREEMRIRRRSHSE